MIHFIDKLTDWWYIILYCYFLFKTMIVNL